MTMEERTAAVERLGFTERQARFLVQVMLFGGLCLPRQYARFNGRAYGHVVTEFFAKLVKRGHATPCLCLHHRGRLYHVRDRRLYEAIGEARHAHRKPVPARQVIERLMRLDSVMVNPHLRWLVTEGEKVAFVRRIAPSFPLARLPHTRVGAGLRARLKLFPDDVLVGVDEAQRPWFVYPATSPVEEDWRVVISRHGDLLAALPHWTFRAAVPPELKPRMGRLRLVFRNELAEPLSASTLAELRWHFEQLRSGAGTRTRREEDRFQRGQSQLMVTSRFRVLHQRWLADGEAAFDVASSHAIVEHLGNQTGEEQCFLLPVSYRHLSPLVSLYQTSLAGVEEGVTQAPEARRNARTSSTPHRVHDSDHPSGVGKTANPQ